MQIMLLVIRSFYLLLFLFQKTYYYYKLVPVVEKNFFFIEDCINTLILKNISGVENCSNSPRITYLDHLE